MADFCITSVKYNPERTHIESVKVREERPAEGKVGPERLVARAFVADLIRLGKATFQTRTRTPEGTFTIGAQVHFLEKEYLTTDRNSTMKDNLGSLPEF